MTQAVSLPRWVAVVGVGWSWALAGALVVALFGHCRRYGRVSFVRGRADGELAGRRELLRDLIQAERDAVPRQEALAREIERVRGLGDPLVDVAVPWDRSA